ncbi:MAG: ribose-5-phosphate isomerase RpiA [Thermomicrobiales bacterium]|nr:ribose-5-phosphate isomerase RpiA [Thermomicrobiales bacterium]
MELAERLARLGTAAAELVEDGQIIGLGTGSTADAMIDALGERVAAGLTISAVVTSSQTEARAKRNGIPVVSLDDVADIAIYLDGADEIDPALTLIKGRGGALLYEKLVSERSARFVVIAASEKLVTTLGLRLPLPIEVIPYGWPHTLERVASLGLEPVLRRSDAGEPVVTDAGNYLLDCARREITDPAALGAAIKGLTGVVEHGLFIGLATDGLIVDETGEINRLTPR